MFYPPTCVGLRYGRAMHLPSGFSRDHGLTRFAQSLRPEPNPRAGGTSLPCGPRSITGTSRTPPSHPHPSPHRSSGVARCRNVCLLRFGYACRPRLSPRLTLGGLASPRKPRVHGGRVTLASLATHASILAPRRSTEGRPSASPLPGTLPYQTEHTLRIRRFGSRFSPVYCRRPSTRPVSCYALFEGVAASKPTSWLSAQTDILCHSTWNWGPWRAVWAVPLSSTQLSPHALTAGVWAAGIRSSVGIGRRRSPLTCPVLYLLR